MDLARLYALAGKAGELAAPRPWEGKMVTDGERKMLMRGVAAGVLVGIGIGLILALFIAMRPELFGALAR